MEIREITKCQNCEVERVDRPAYFWRKADLYKMDTTKRIEAVEIYCGRCARTITVLPVSLFPAAED